MFYINYEECKSLHITYINQNNYCFILTMRNVNKVFLVASATPIYCFILTMRNVNLFPKAFLFPLGAFYINYEECKFM